MTKSLLMAGAAALSLGLMPPSLALASGARPDPVASEHGVLVFVPAFFADARPNTALDMVNRVPGFAVNDGDGSRGFEGSVGNILINGARPASKNDAGSSVLSRTAASQVERIELIRGGAPGIDMQGHAVVANVILKTTSSREHVLNAAGYFFEGGRDMFTGTYQFTAREGDRTWGVTLSDSLSMSDSNGKGVITRLDASGNVLRRETYYNDNYGGGNGIRGTYAGPLFGGKIDLTARYGVNDWHSIDQQSSATVMRENLSEEDTDGGEIGIVYTRPLGAKLNLETRFSHDFTGMEGVSTSRTRQDGIDSPEQRFTAEGDASETILRGLLKVQRSPEMDFEMGAEVAYNMLELDQAYSVGGEVIVLPSASVKVEETRGEAFGKATWRINPQWTIEGGLRLETSTISQSGDASQEESFFFAKPRLVTTWRPKEGHQLRLRLERTVGQLDFRDFAAKAEFSNENLIGGNVDLRPESRFVSELAYEYRFWEEGIVSLTLRHDEISDAIDVVPLLDGLSAVGNIGDGTLDQLAVNLALPTDKLGLSGGKLGFRNTWNWTEVTDPTTGLNRSISNVRPSQAVISFEQTLPSIKAEWGAAWIPRLGQNGYRPDQLSGWTGEDYLEFWAEYKPQPGLSIRAQVNIWDTFDQERTVFADRTTRQIAYVETRNIDPRTFYQIRLRKTF